jgi:hypothetical protein
MSDARRTRRGLTRANILPPAQYAAERREQRWRLNAIKKRRRVDVGTFASFYFENYETMWHQVHEMLHIEKGGEAQIADELAAYNPLIPQGNELVATLMFEIEDAVRWGRELARLGGVENCTYLDIDGMRVRGEPDPTRENTSPEGKAFSVQFVWFRLSPEQAARFKKAKARIVLGIDHPNYGHMAGVPEAVRAALAEDLD